MSQKKGVDIVGDFLSRYRKEFDFYDQAARLAARQLDALLLAAGIRAIVTSRAKNESRLEAKVRERDKKKRYATVEDVYEDIVDLAGVRLALYFPGDRAEVDKLIQSHFKLIGEPKVFPETGSPSYDKRFSGYWATHYRIRVPQKMLTDAEQHYKDAPIEVQVASVLMHAWAEVEHDLVYKPLAGKLSSEELAILDQLNGLVLVGESALERLQRAMKVRVAQSDRKFESHFELAVFLLDAARPILVKAPKDTDLGRVDQLHALIKECGLDTPGKLQPFLKNLHGDTERRPIAEQLVDQILGADQQRYSAYLKVRSLSESIGSGRLPKSSASNEDKIRFLESWIGFESALRLMLMSRVEHASSKPVSKLLSVMPQVGGVVPADIEQIRKTRNHLVHGLETYDGPTLSSAARRLDKITTALKNSRV